MELLQRARAQGSKVDLQNLIEAIPYCRFLGIKVDRKGSELTMILRFDRKPSATRYCRHCTAGVIGAFLRDHRHRTTHPGNRIT